MTPTSVEVSGPVLVAPSHHTLSLALPSGTAEELDAVEGNEFRDVWKASCWEMLEEVIPTSCMCARETDKSLCVLALSLHMMFMRRQCLLL